MSEGEHHRGIGLLTMQAAGKISELKFQPPYKLSVDGEVIGKIVLDFSYIDENGQEICEDYKGSRHHIEPLAKWKFKHFKAQYGKQVKITD